MTIPTKDQLYLPILEYSKDGKEHKLKDTRLYLEEYFQLTPEEKAERLTSGQLKFANRTGWARTHLKKAGLMETTRNGYAKITQEGLKVLKEKPEKLDDKYLQKYPTYRKFLNIEQPTQIETQITNTENSPEEIIENQFKIINKSLAEDLFESIINNTPEFFEKLVVDLLIAMGYGGFREEAGHTVGKSGDGGIDGIIDEDKLGLNQIYIQAKKFKEQVIGRPEIQKFAGALDGQKATKGVYITTSHFTKNAKEYANNSNFTIILIDGNKLTDLMIEYGIGVSTAQTYKFKKIDNDYFFENE